MPSISGYVEKTLAQRVGRKCALDTPRPIVSFTFDDFPRSALLTAGAMLHAEGLRATFYTSLGLMDSTTSVGAMFTPRDIQQLLRDGHELACHSYHHLSCRKESAEAFRADCTHNRELAARLFEGQRLCNFSFPYGELTLAAHSMLARDYDSCRSIERGVNHGRVNLSCLKSVAVYADIPESVLAGFIRRNSELRGWLIFYTHDVVLAPSRYGCTPEQFRRTLSSVIRSGADILAVSEVVKLITNREPFSAAQ